MIKYAMLVCPILLGILTINHYSRGLIWEPLFFIWIVLSVLSFLVYRLETSKF
jgi:hypothetical protein